MPGSLTPADLRARAAALRAPTLGEDPRPAGSERKKTEGRREKLKALAKQKKEAAKGKNKEKGEGRGKRRSKFRWVLLIY